MPQDEEPTKISLMSNCDLNKMSFIYMTTKNRFYQSRLAFSVDKIMKIMIIMLKVFIDNYPNIYINLCVGRTTTVQEQLITSHRMAAVDRVMLVKRLPVTVTNVGQPCATALLSFQAV